MLGSGVSFESWILTVLKEKVVVGMYEKAVSWKLIPLFDWLTDW